jgi:TRAP-type mannitol/chloroaromatic compound transport system substrate-binding protein
MNKKLIIGALVVCLLAFVAVMAFSQSSTNVRWEYSSSWPSVSDMNDKGQQGWELVAVSNNQAIFKRRLP